MHPLAKLDHRYIWHPFTQMKDWLRHEPILIVQGKGAVLRDANGREYLDANSSIWTNLHGHNHPKLNAAIARQLKKIAHSSALGFANEPASLLAELLVNAAGIYDLRFTNEASPLRPARESQNVNRKLEKVFFSDDGSTALEVALKLSFQFAQRVRGIRKPRFLSLRGAYHGDTIGAVSLGHIDLFHGAYRGLLFKSDSVPAPYCYRCPHNRAKPERHDARDCRKCNFECLNALEQKLVTKKKKGEQYAAFVFEPLMQGAAGMIAQPRGWLKQATDLAREHGAQLIADEVMTGFGRTGPNAERGMRGAESLFACQQENVRPDFLCVAKGMTGGYLPMAATLTTQEVFDAFLGEYEEFKTFYHGHSFTGNQLGAAASLASLEILRTRFSIESRRKLQRALEEELRTLWSLPNVGDIRQVGLVAGVELVRDWKTREPFALQERAGIRVCDAMARRGVLTRPIGNVIVIMPPYCTTTTQLRKIIATLRESVEEVMRTITRER
jgi:adenosylmethionine-8-amino-7-oxononanoate aminotransferase